MRYQAPIVLEVSPWDILGTPEDHLLFHFSPQISSWMNTDTLGYQTLVLPAIFPKRSRTRVCE